MTRSRIASSVAAALVVALLLTASACSSSSSVGGNALEVNGSTLSNKDFNDRLAAIAGNKAYVAKLTGADGQPLKPNAEGSAPGTYSTDFTTQVLNQQVSFDLAAQEVATRGLTVSDDDKAQAEKLLAQDLTSAQATSASSAPVDDGTGQKALDDLGTFKPVIIAGVANILALQNDYTTQLSTDDALKSEFDKTADTFKNQACVSIIVASAGNPTTDANGAPVPPPDTAYVPALAKANDLLAQLKSGADFATLAKSSSDNATTGQQGGDIGCQALGAYKQSLPELDAAIAAQPVGQVGAPVKTALGYLLVMVRSRGDLTFDQAKDQIKKTVTTRARTAFQDWLAGAAKKASVTVDPQYGTWDSQQGTIVPPAGATSTTTTPAATGDTSLTPDQLGQLNGTGSPSSTTTAP